MISDPFQIPPVLYYVVMAIVLLGWLALIIFPRRPWANFWFSGVIVPQVLCLFYMYLLLTFWFLERRGHFLDFASLPGVYKLFSNSGLLLVAWINIIAMDLVVGAWMTRKAQQVGMPYILLLPCLITTFIFAGFGFTMFSIAAALGGRWGAIAKFEAEPPTTSEALPVVTPSTLTSSQH